MTGEEEQPTCTIADMEATSDSLECGTSLAELEHEHSSNFLSSTEEASSSNALREKDKGAGTAVDSVESLRDFIAADVWTEADEAEYTTFDSPFPLDLTPGAPKVQARKIPMVYCDQTATNRPVKSIENYIAKVCLPLYGNTHTNTSITGSQSTAFVAEARQIVAEETNAKITGKASQDVVLFAGQGATSAVQLLIDCLGLAFVDKSHDKRPIVFVGPYEHHSVLIPFRESGCEIAMVPETRSNGLSQVDIKKLDQLLQREEYTSRLKMGVFSAASNVTGKTCNVREISAALHRNGALAFFDYATAASYTSIDMNPPPCAQYPSPSMIAKDAVFFSPHKMLGGVGSPGVLIIKKHLVSQNNPPARSGGGTVFYVTNNHHRFLSNRIERYEGGSPNVPGIIRVGLAFLLKRKAEQLYAAARTKELAARGDNDLPDSIEAYDCHTYSRVAQYLKQHAPNLVLLDYCGTDEKKLPIFSFLIRFGHRFLHYNYVCAILNDVFGIQSRGGCQCAGPYSQRLLGLTTLDEDGLEIPSESNMEIEHELIHSKERAELLRPGFTRLSLPYKGLKSVEVDYVMKALLWTSKHAWALMCQYRCSHRTGEFRHFSRQGRPLGQERKWLGHFDFLTPAVPKSLPTQASYSDFLSETLASADSILAAAVADQSSISQALKMAGVDYAGDGERLDELRWYVHAKECAAYLAKGVLEAPSCDDLVGAIKPSIDFELVGPSVTPLGTDDEVDSSNTNSTPCVGPCVPGLQKEPKRVNRDQQNWGKGAAVKQLIPSETKANLSSPVAMNKGGISGRHRHIKPPAKLMRLVTNAVMQWGMIQPGDRLLLGLSGGKDSLALLHCLMELQRKLPTKFELEVCTIDPSTPSFDPSPLIPYVEGLGLRYHYIRDNIVDRASTSGTGGGMVKSLCAYCSRMKRGNLYAVARRSKCNKLVLAQHLDDCAESFMMSIMHNGFLRTMKANYKINSGDLSVIRPLVYCRESLTADFARAANLPVINENCPACFEEPKERARVKKLLSREETLYPNFYDNIRRSLLPLMHEDATAILRCYTEETLARSRKNQKRGRSSPLCDETHTKRAKTYAMDTVMADISDQDLVLELARRKAEMFHLAGAMKRNGDALTEFEDEIDDIRDKVCSSGGVCDAVGCGKPS